jgi:hypothetical protein
MGITVAQANMLMEARMAGTSFEKVLTIGRQTNYLASSSSATLRRFPFLADITPEVMTAPFADAFIMRVLRARDVDSLDISDYEGATVLHDMNQPVPPSLHGQYDVVIESGSLEHVFDFPTAVLNCMHMVKLGGSVFLSLPVNNFVGHGFYQFSPELFFRVFSRSNGFFVRTAALAEAWFMRIERGVKFPLYRPIDPAQTGGRIHLMTGYPTFLMLHAVRVGDVPVKIQVQQSDYHAVWHATDQAPGATSISWPVKRHTSPMAWLRKIGAWAISLLPDTSQTWIRSQYERRRYYSLTRRAYFVPLEPGKRSRR